MLKKIKDKLYGGILRPSYKSFTDIVLTGKLTQEEWDKFMKKLKDEGDTNRTRLCIDKGAKLTETVKIGKKMKTKLRSGCGVTQKDVDKYLVKQ